MPKEVGMGSKPVKPNLTDTAWEVGIELCEGVLVEVTTRDTGDEDGAGLSRRGMLFTDKILLTDSDKMGHLAFDEVPNPD